MRFPSTLCAWRLRLFLLAVVCILVEAEAYVATKRSRRWIRPTSKSKSASVPADCVLQRDGSLWPQATREGSTAQVVTHLRAGASPAEEKSNLLLSKHLLPELCAEFIGTFIIVSLGTGSVMSDVFGGALNGLFQVAAVWIIAVTLAISTTGHISGAHLNPAISIALAMFRPSLNFGWSKVLPYTIAQTAGATLASWLNLLMYAPLIRVFEQSHGIVRGSPQSIASAKAFGEYFLPPITRVTAFCAEAFGTAILAFVIFALTHHRNTDSQKNVYIPPLIGSCVGALIVLIAPLTQAGLNPARDFGPRIVAYLAGWGKIAFQGWWVYVIAPIVGAPVGAFVADKILNAESPQETRIVAKE